MVLCYSIKSGNWNDSTVWYNSRIPQNSDTVEIRANHNVEVNAEINAIGTTTIKNLGILTIAFEMNTSNFAAITIDVGGKIYASRLVNNVLRVAGIVTANGVLDYGTEADPILNVGAAFVMVCTSDSQGSRYVSIGNNNSVMMYGKSRTRDTTLASPAIVGANTIVLTDDLALRPGTLEQAIRGQADIICVNHTTTITNNPSVGGDELDYYLVSGYDPATKTVTLGDCGAGNTFWYRGGISPNYNTIDASREVGTKVHLVTYNVIFRSSAYNLRMFQIFAGFNNKTFVIRNSCFMWCYRVLYNATTCLVDMLNVSFIHSVNTIEAIHNWSDNNTCYYFGCYYTFTWCNYNNFYGVSFGGYNINGCFRCNIYGKFYSTSTVLTSSRYCYFYGEAYNCYSIMQSCPVTCYICTGAIINGCYYIIIYSIGIIQKNIVASNILHVAYGSSVIIYDNVFSIATNLAYLYTNGKIYNCSGYTNDVQIALDYYTGNSYLELFGCGGVAGSYKAISNGGICIKDTTVYPTGKTYSYKITLRDNNYGFKQDDYNLMPYERLHFRAWIKKSKSMVYLPRLQIVDKILDPLNDATYSVLAEKSMTDSIDTWEYVDLYYYNNSSLQRQVCLRVTGKDTSGDIYFYSEIKRDHSINCDMEGI